MKTANEIHAQLQEIEKDVRLYYPTANVLSNAPLAMIQLSLETQSTMLRDVLGLPFRDFEKERSCHRNNPGF